MAANKIILNGSTILDLTADTATAADVASGKTFHLASGEQAVGTGSLANNHLALLVSGQPVAITAEDLAGATEIATNAFYESSVTSVEIPESVTSIGEEAFYLAKSLTSVEIPESVTSIEVRAFYGCSSLTSVEIPASVTSIGASAFFTCSGLTSLVIPASVTSIGSMALQIGSTTNKATITMLSTTPPTISSSTFLVTKLEAIIVPAGTGDTYKAATNWSNFADYIVEATA